MDENTSGLIDHINNLGLTARKVLKGVEQVDSVIQEFALGLLHLGAELLEGIESELRANPPRALNAMRLARHLWEAETDLHYVQHLGADGIRQLCASEARRRIELAREVIPNWDARKEETRWLGLLELVESAEAREKSRTFTAATATDRGFIPGRRQILKVIDRHDEMASYYGASSWFSHPNLHPMSHLVTVDTEGRVGDGISQSAGLPGMSASLGRVAGARLILRASRILDAADAVEGLEWFMNREHLTETGVVREEDDAG